MFSLSPQGRGRGEGFGSFRIKLHRPNPLNLSFSPLGRMDAARRLQLRLHCPKGKRRVGRRRAVPTKAVREALMSRYRRLKIEGGAFFFTLALAGRDSDLLVRFGE